MSESYTENTESSETGTESYTENTTDQTTTEEAKSDEQSPEEEAKNEQGGEEEEKKGEQEQEKEPEPEPEPDPLEGLTYDDDPEAELPPYSDPSYWEKRYTDKPETFEWYQDPEPIMPYVKELFNPEGSVLVIGTGTSELAPQIQQSGFENVTAIDFVKPPIKFMRKKYSDPDAGVNITWKVMDVRKMNKFGGENSFMSIIDKGTIDCLFHAGEDDVMTALSEISRILKKRGVFVCISYRPEEEMRPYLDRPSELLLELEKVEKLKKPLPSDEPHYVYVLRKVQKLIS